MCGKDIVSINSSEELSSISSLDGTASDPTLDTHNSLCCCVRTALGFPDALLSSPMQAGTAAISPSHTENFSAETHTPDPYPKSKGNESTNTFSQGLTESLGQSKKLHLCFKTALKIELAAHQELSYSLYNTRVWPQSLEPDYSTHSTRHCCSLTSYSVH